MKCCLVGKKLGHSFSSEIHSMLGVDYSHVEIENGEEALEEFVKDNPYDCYNVTIPYKQAIIPFLDKLDNSAMVAGAVNTVVKKEGKSIGYNTDVGGMQTAISMSGYCLKGKKILILGSGGTASTAKTLAKIEGGILIGNVSRNGEINYNNYMNVCKDAEVIINCTPIGMYPNVDDCPIDIDCFDKLEFVFDAVYNPLQTRLISKAKQKNIISSNGLPMLVAQAVLAENIFWGFEKFDMESQIRTILKTIFDIRRNIVLVGMPSAGKTTIGKKLANVLKKQFIDTDVEIKNKYGIAPSVIIIDKGEAVFREYEKDVVEEVSKMFGCIIATGGGSIINPQNQVRLKQNSFVVWIKRDFSKLVTKNRPLSKDKNNLENMEKIRFPLYNKIADCIVDNNGKIDDAVEIILEKYNEYTCY